MKLHLSSAAAAAAAVLLSAFSGNASATSLRASLTSESAGNSPETEDYELASYEGEDEEEAPLDADAELFGKSVCYTVSSDMTFNALTQGWLAILGTNPDKEATGYTTCKLCTSGWMRCQETQVNNVHSRLIGSHIHVCENGNDGKDCSGPPVINFCGDDNWVIKPKPGYSKKCTMVDEDTHTANIGVMWGKHVTEDTMSLEERVSDIGMHPHKYYFNFHSDASWAHWSNAILKKNKGDPKGMCRGRLETKSSTVMEMERELENGKQ